MTRGTCLGMRESDLFWALLIAVLQTPAKRCMCRLICLHTRGEVDLLPYAHSNNLTELTASVYL